MPPKRSIHSPTTSTPSPTIINFVKDIMHIDSSMGLELLKTFVYSSLRLKHSMEYHIDYGYYKTRNVPNNIPFLKSYVSCIKNLLKQKPLSYQYIYICIWFVHEYLCDKDYQKTFSKYVINTDDDIYKVNDLVEYTSYNDNAMQSIYRYVLANWNILIELLNYLRNTLKTLSDPLVVKIEYNTFEGLGKKYYKVYAAQVDIETKDVAILIRYGITSKCNSDFNRIHQLMPHLLKGRKRMVFDLKSLTLQSI